MGNDKNKKYRGEVISVDKVLHQKIVEKQIRNLVSVFRVHLNTKIKSEIEKTREFVGSGTKQINIEEKIKSKSKEQIRNEFNKFLNNKRIDIKPGYIRAPQLNQLNQLTSDYSVNVINKVTNNKDNNKDKEKDIKDKEFDNSESVNKQDKQDYETNNNKLEKNYKIDKVVYEGNYETGLKQSIETPSYNTSNIGVGSNLGGPNIVPNFGSNIFSPKMTEKEVTFEYKSDIFDKHDNKLDKHERMRILERTQKIEKLMNENINDIKIKYQNQPKLPIIYQKYMRRSIPDKSEKTSYIEDKNSYIDRLEGISGVLTINNSESLLKKELKRQAQREMIRNEVFKSADMSEGLKNVLRKGSFFKEERVNTTNTNNTNTNTNNKDKEKIDIIEKVN